MQWRSSTHNYNPGHFECIKLLATDLIDQQKNVNFWRKYFKSFYILLIMKSFKIFWENDVKITRRVYNPEKIDEKLVIKYIRTVFDSVHAKPIARTNM
jgi:hypothetical protein